MHTVRAATTLTLTDLAGAWVARHLPSREMLRRAKAVCMRLLMSSSDVAHIGMGGESGETLEARLSGIADSEWLSGPQVAIRLGAVEKVREQIAKHFERIRLDLDEGRDYRRIPRAERAQRGPVFDHRMGAVKPKLRKYLHDRRL